MEIDQKVIQNFREYLLCIKLIKLEIRSTKAETIFNVQILNFFKHSDFIYLDLFQISDLDIRISVFIVLLLKAGLIFF